MGTVRAVVRVSNPANGRFAELELLVDTGATFTLIPRAIFEEIGAEADTSFRLRLADGRSIQRDGGTIFAEVEGRRYRVPVVVGEEGDTPVLGTTTLEILGLKVDPVAQKLEPTEHLLLELGGGQRSSPLRRLSGSNRHLLLAGSALST